VWLDPADGSTEPQLTDLQCRLVLSHAR